METILRVLGLNDFDGTTLLVHVGVLLLAFLCALPLGLDREKHTRLMGVRTFPLVSVAAASFVLIGRAVFGDDSGDAHARLLQGLMTGVGFLGGGVILKQGDRVLGTATAAAIWGTAGIGAAVAYGQLEIALVLSGLSFVLVRHMRMVKDGISSDDHEGATTSGPEREATS